MIVRTAPKRPMIFAFAFLDRQVINAGDAKAHQPLFVELPIFIAIAAKPVAAVVVPFIGEAHGDAISAESPDFLDQPVIKFARPFARQESFDGVAPMDELGAVPPAAVSCIS